MAAAVGLVDRTPEGYRNAATNESDPSPADINDFEKALRSGEVDVLVVNTQTEGSIPAQLRARGRGGRRPDRRGDRDGARRRAVVRRLAGRPAASARRRPSSR